MHIAGREGITHFDRVVDQHQFDFEVLAARRFPNLLRFESVIRMNDRSPASPHIEREANGVVGHWLVGRDPFHRRQLLRRLKGVFLDGRDARIVVSFHRTRRNRCVVASAAEPLQVDDFVGLILLALRREQVGAIDREPNQAKDDGCHCQIEGNFRLTRHDVLSVLEK